jgi:hypothetical protein
MKHIHFIIIFGLFILIGCEQQSLKPCLKSEGESDSTIFKLEKFSGVELSADVDVFVKQYKDQSVSIIGPKNLIKTITVEVSGGAIRISSNRCFAESSIRPKVFISVPEVTRLEISGNGNIFTKGKILCDVVEFKLVGAGTMDLYADANRIVTSLIGSGNIVLQGSANNHFVKLPGSGQVSAYALETNDTDIDISGWGLVESFTQKNLKGKISGNGQIHYKGYPLVKSEISGEGKLQAFN